MMPSMADETAWHERRIVYETDDMGDISPSMPHLYSSRAGRPARLYAYRPTRIGPTTKPGVIFIHGGPVPLDHPAPTDWGQYQSWGQLAAASGLIGFTFDHSYTDFNSLESGAADVATAISYIRSNASEFHLDPNRICLWACSGGGPFLGNALREQPDYIRCVVIYYAYMDLRHKAEIVNALPGDIVYKHSPAAWISNRKATGIPILVTKAGLDDPALNETIESFIDQAVSGDWDIELLTHETGHHGFDVNDDDPSSRAIIARTVEFINANI